MRLFPPASFRLELTAECGSTNEELLNRRGQPNFHGSALIALRQTAGYGRRGKDWQTGEGNLALSLAMTIPQATAPMPLLPFLAGLALYDQAALHVPHGAELRLKWPNDLYLNGLKLAGMLAQARSQGEHNDVVLGIGVNLAQAPGAVPAIALGDLGETPDAERFALCFLLKFEKLLAEEPNFETLREAWEKKARLKSGPLFVLGERTPLHAKALLDTGELLVVDEHGAERRLSSETVSLRYEPLV